MLSVKHLQITGHEEIYPAARVSFQPRLRSDGTPAKDGGATDDIAPCVFVESPKGETKALGSFGAVYVMNDAGKTVQRWDLGGWPGPTSMPPAPPRQP